MTSHATIVPTLRYHDAAAAIAWLCRAFGFQKHLVVPGEEGAIVHAQLTFGNGMITVSSAAKKDDPFAATSKTPKELGGANTQSAYVIVEDVDAHHARAVEGGARVVYALREEPYGGKGYSCLDPEGYLWHFGSYDPWRQAKG
jgi:uncharacterized glyoxalase superfamily protein PhnB